jgi:peptide/nickel transport system permease protein
MSAEARPLAIDVALDRHARRAPVGLYRRALQRLMRDRVAVVALAVLAAMVGVALAANLISAHVTGFGPDDNHLSDRLAAPFRAPYYLGTDGNGRDLLTRLAYGGRVTLLVAVLATAGTVAIGGLVGLVAGYSGGVVDGVLMRLIDVLLSIPQLPLLILVATVWSPGPVGVAAILVGIGWGGVARQVRAEALAQQGRDYVMAARVAGASPARIVASHVGPNVVPLVVVVASLTVPGLMLAETGLSFLGMGVKPPVPTWGNMLGEAQGVYRLAPSNVLFPGLALFVTALACYLVGARLRDALDPRLAE